MSSMEWEPTVSMGWEPTVSMGWEPTVSYDEKQALYGKTATQIANGCTKHKITLDLTIDETLLDTAKVHVETCNVENKRPVLTGNEINSAIPGTIVGLVVEGVPPIESGYEISLDNLTCDNLVRIDGSPFDLSEDELEDTREDDTETGIPLGHWAHWFIMPSSDVTASVNVFTASC